MIILNAVKCLKCGDTIESEYRHDFKWCSCESVAVDGGHSYLKRAYKDDAKFIDLSEYGQDDEEDDQNEDS